MTPSLPQNSVADYYFSLLQSLDSVSKLDLIAKLSQSLKEEVVAKRGRSLEELFGAYQSDETAEEMIAAIRSSRVFNRNTEPL